MSATAAERHTGRRTRRRLVLQPVQACPCCGEMPNDCPDGCLIRKDRERCAEDRGR